MQKHEGIETLVSDIIHLRTGEMPGGKGLRSQHIEFLHVNNETKILAYKRFDANDPTEPVLVILNFSNQEYKDYGIGLNENQPFMLKINAGSEIYDNAFSNMEVADVEFVDKVTDAKHFTGKMNIPAYGALIYTMK